MLTGIKACRQLNSGKPQALCHTLRKGFFTNVPDKNRPAVCGMRGACCARERTPARKIDASDTLNYDVNHPWLCVSSKTRSRVFPKELVKKRTFAVTLNTVKGLKSFIPFSKNANAFVSIHVRYYAQKNGQYIKI